MLSLLSQNNKIYKSTNPASIYMYATLPLLEDVDTRVFTLTYLVITIIPCSQSCDII